MKTILVDQEKETEINKSRFIALLYKVNSLDEIKKYLDEAKIKYKDATHYCYAYIIDDNRKASDDGEPGGTAGLPIMEVLLKNDLNYVLCVVVRYFGGIKLGAGGLVRAYSNAASSTIDKENIVTLVPGYLISFNTSYEEQKKYDYILKDLIVQKEYGENILYKVQIKKEDLDIIKNIDYKIIQEIYIEEK